LLQLHREQSMRARTPDFIYTVRSPCFRRLRSTDRNLPVGDGGQHRRVVGDQKHRQTTLAVLANQPTPSSAGGRIECCGWLIGHQ
jgi:hypothetical protein